MATSLLAGRLVSALVVMAVVASLTGVPGVLAANERVNINTASSESLQTLPGIGPAVAQRIIEYREQNGAFKRTAELMNVKGIGEKTFDRLKDRIIIGDDGKK